MIARLMQKHDQKVHRALEILPGLLTWGLILSPIWLSILYPPAMVYLLTFLTIYWSYMALRHTAGLPLGYSKYQREMKTNWWQKCEKVVFKDLSNPQLKPKNLKEVKHFILIPAVDEPDSVLKPSIESILSQTFPPKQVTIVYTIEEKYAKDTKNRILNILGGLADSFDEFLIFIHPSGLEGEAIGAAAANRTWGARNAAEHLKKTGKDIRNYIFTTIDCDHVLNPQYLARLTHLYLAADNPDNYFYATAVHLFDNNHWKVPAMMRIEANFVTLGTLASRSLPWGIEDHTKDTFAAYSVSLQTLIDADYWDVTLGVDDTIFYWRAFFARDGNFRLATHYIPYSADAVESDTYWKSHKSLYMQLLRWGWGVIEVPYSIKRLLANKKVPLGKKIMWFYDHFKTRVMLINIVFLLTFGFGIATLINPNLRQSSFAYSLPNMMSYVLTFTLIFLLPNAFYRAKICKKIPEEWPIWRKAATMLESFLVIGNLLTFSFLPFVEAQTRMMLGIKMKDLYHTPKFRKT